MTQWGKCYMRLCMVLLSLLQLAQSEDASFFHLMQRFQDFQEPCAGPPMQPIASSSNIEPSALQLLT